MLGDAKIVLARMLGTRTERQAAKRKAWLEKSRLICEEWYSKYQPMLQSDAVPIRPGTHMRQAHQGLPDDAIVVVDTGHAGDVDGRIL